MPLAAKLEKEVEIPENVTVSRSNDEIKVSGENGESIRTFDNPMIKININNDKITFEAEEPTKREKALLGTYTSHLRNMVEGAQKDYEYKLKIIYSHFPVKVRVEGNEVVIENFIGESKPRKAEILGDTKAQIKGDQVILNGPNKEEVAQTAANIELTTRIKGTDPRVFQDGIYIVEKAGKPIR
ncbi:MAG: 50S ribosomal protein L6 [Thermoplasmata archaeon]